MAQLANAVEKANLLFIQRLLEERVTYVQNHWTREFLSIILKIVFLPPLLLNIHP
jgi:hypothetical protein